ncbi:TadE/TadG family type IV pilus assembly protein [Streptomyces bohaiensis]|uniref:TadE/TadG family type IV pilus assembly protein n=2 Tax=Streptomyces bohaiensis TaxID=1431344 RepID=UPI003B829B78
MERRPRPAATRRPARAGGWGGSERDGRAGPAGPPPGHRTTARCAPRGDRGAVLVEFAGIFPYVLLMLAVIWQCILIGYTFSLAGNAADQAARAGAAARGGAAGACAEAAARHVPDAWSVNASCGQQGDIYRAEVTLRVPALFPGVLDMPFDVPGRAGAAAEG